MSVPSNLTRRNRYRVCLGIPAFLAHSFIPLFRHASNICTLEYLCPRSSCPSFACTLKYQCPQPSFLRRDAAPPPFCVLAEYVVVCATRLPSSSHRYSSHVSGYFGHVTCLSWIIQAPMPGPKCRLLLVCLVCPMSILVYCIMYSSPVPRLD